MKTYVIPASNIVTGYRRQTRWRTETNNASGTSYSSWTNNRTSVLDNNSNRIKYVFASSKELIASGSGYSQYKETQTLDDYRIDLTFNISGVPTNRIQSVALRAKLTGKSDDTPRGYYISSVGDTGGVFDSTYPHFEPRTQLGNCSLNNISGMPYTHDTVLSGLSSTGWYTLWNYRDTAYNKDELLAFSMSNFYLVITTDESSGSTYTITYNKGTYGVGTNTTATKTEDQAIQLLDAIFTRDDYTQTGWSTNANGSTKDYELSENYTANANITLYPYWTMGHVASGNVLFIMTENGLQALI